ncbi:hypothetical protein TNCV_2449161 [Trichonephila clavipes]|uniref:Uncharacterized protein n=1 Tax=Trichonephila clavipes TaxID=2585209 RepID=A0A8X6VN21_TRICX|nr:hypothetical protein TNCV_2449161 [Trichonephila clavipes]
MSTTENFKYAGIADIHYIYGRANYNGRAVLQMYHAQFPDREMLYYRIFLWLHHETRSFHVTRHDAGRRKVVRNPSLEESIFNVGADRPKSNTSFFTLHESVSQQINCRMLNENRLHLFQFQIVQALNSANFILRLTMNATIIGAAAGLHSSCVEQLWTVNVNIVLVKEAFY